MVFRYSRRRNMAKNNDTSITIRIPKEIKQ